MDREEKIEVKRLSLLTLQKYIEDINIIFVSGSLKKNVRAIPCVSNILKNEYWTNTL